MNKRKQRYCRLRTMADVQNERIKLSKMMKANQADLAQDWDEIGYWLSPSNLIDELMCKVYASSSLIRNVVAGVRTAITMIRNRMSR